MLFRSSTNSLITYSLDGGEDLTKVIVDAFEHYAVSNPLHPDVFPAVRKMEAEIVAMCLRMFNNPTGAGATTSGGTESIIMSVKTHRDWARATKGITEPEMYVTSSSIVSNFSCLYMFVGLCRFRPTPHLTRVLLISVSRYTLSQ